jgi:hypothetical protein
MFWPNMDSYITIKFCFEKTILSKIAKLGSCFYMHLLATIIIMILSFKLLV